MGRSNMASMKVSLLFMGLAVMLSSMSPVSGKIYLVQTEDKTPDLYHMKYVPSTWKPKWRKRTTTPTPTTTITTTTPTTRTTKTATTNTTTKTTTTTTTTTTRSKLTWKTKRKPRTKSMDYMTVHCSEC